MRHRSQAASLLRRRDDKRHGSPVEVRRGRSQRAGKVQLSLFSIARPHLDVVEAGGGTGQGGKGVLGLRAGVLPS